MANGASTDQFVVVSRIRSGLKRELQFALKSQSEICGGSLGRTRSRKNPNGDSGSAKNRRNSQRSDKRFKGSSGLKLEGKKRRIENEEQSDSDEFHVVTVPEEEEAKSDVVDMDEAKGDLVESVNRRLFCDEAIMPIVEESALVESGEPIYEDDEQEEKKEKEEESETEKSLYDKCEEEEEKREDISEMRQPELILVKDGEGKKEGEHESANEKEMGASCLSICNVASEPMSSPCECSGIKLGNSLVDNPLRRLTRSLLKSKVETNTAEAKSDAEQISVDEVANCHHDDGAAAASNSPVASPEKQTEEGVLKDQEEKKVGEKELVNMMGTDDFIKEKLIDPLLGASEASSKLSLIPSKVESGSIDKHLRRFTRSLLKQGSGSDKYNARNDAEATNLNKVSDDVKMDDAPSFPHATSLKQGTPKKILRNFPIRLKDLLGSGILEGLTVNYVRGLKSKGTGTLGLKGVIKDSGILCFCSACKGTEVVSPAVYELHASSSNKRPPEYTLLENGNSLRDVMNACKETPLEKLEEILCGVVGSSLKTSNFCLNCRGPIRDPCDTKALVICSSCREAKEPQKVSEVKSTEASYAIKSSSISPEPGAGPKSIHSESRHSSSRSNSQGRITRKDVRLHKLVFEEDVLPDGTEVGYFVRGQKMLVGYKKGFGILCSCCETVVSPSQFEAHAGCAIRRKPFQHIYTSNGVSLHELSIALSQDRKFSSHENDDLCSICWDGGDLLCCDTCPRSFHAVCTSLPSIPSESWSCKYCQNMFLREKFVKNNANAIAAGRVVGVDAIAEITKRCIRIVDSLGSGLPSVCILCRGHSFSRLGFGPRTVIICDQCEKEFHVGCLKEHNIDELKELPEGHWFCGSDCNKIYTALQKLIINGEEKLPDSFLDLVKKQPKPREENGSDNSTNLDIRWRVLSGKLASSDDTKVLLSKAVSIFHERFDPISDSGARGDLIPGMVYGRQVKGQDFGGMYCTILTVNELIVSVGIFRIFGSELAELPLVATSGEYQGQGYFQCLFACIERLLGFLNVRHLVLPAADEAKSIWTDKFGFNKMTQDEVNEYRKDFQMMIFEGTSMLRKPVPTCSVIDKPEEAA